MLVAAPTPANTCAIICTYFPDERFAERIESVQEQFRFVVVIDNGSSAACLQMLRGLECERLRLVENTANLGLAAALNQGAGLAMELGYEWVVTFDQDTQAYATLLPELIAIYHAQGRDKVIIGANYWNAYKRRNFIHCDAAETGFRERKTLITSGCLTPIAAFETLGPFREDYFIDSVDHEFCLRARRHGWRMLISCKPLMSQCIGDDVGSSNRVRRLIAFEHLPVRKYFIARNATATVRAYLVDEPAWCLRQGLRLIADLVSILLFEQCKLQKFAAFCVGVAHGLVGKMGPIEKTWPNGAHG